MSSAAAQRAGVIEARLEAVLGARLSAPLRQLSSGASRETYTFATAAHGELVLQVDRGAEPGAGQPASWPRQRRQAALLQAAAEAGVPVSRVVAHGAEDEALGAAWTVVEALAGGAEPKPILAGDGAPPAAQLLDQIAAALAAVHRMPADGSLAAAVEDPIGVLRATHDALGEPHPVFELAFRALGSAPPGAAPARRTFVHGDFRMGNLMIAEQGLVGVLDWELAHVGDPVEDLGWLCVPAWRFDRPDRPAAGLGTHEQLLEAYARHAGVEVDPAALAWWELAGTLRWGVITVMQAFTHLSGAARSVEHAVIGRRACEVEWDLLEMLDKQAGQDVVADAVTAASGAVADTDTAAPGAVAEADTAGAAPALAFLWDRPTSGRALSLHDRPTAVELIEAARGALGDEVLPLLDGRAAFQTRVSLRALGMVRRELELAGEHAALRGRLLDELGLPDERELAAAIRDGRLAGSDHELRAALRQLVSAKLAVANPRYVKEEDS